MKFMLTRLEIDMIAEQIAKKLKPPDEIMNIERVATFLDTTKTAIAKRMERNQIPYHKEAGFLYFSRNEVTAYYLSKKHK